MFLSCFAFSCLIYVSLELKKMKTQKCQCVQTKSPNKSQLSLAKGPGKGQPSKIESVYMAASTLARRHRKNYGILQTHARKD